MTYFIPESALKAFVAIAVIVRGNFASRGNRRLRKLDIQIDCHTVAVNYRQSHKFGEMQITWKH